MSCDVSIFMRLSYFALLAACSSSVSTEAAPRHAVVTTTSTTVATANPTAVTVTTTPSPTVAVAAAAPIETPAPPAPKVVLHLGDSMVGGNGGVSKALEHKFKELGAKFVRDWQEGVGIQTFDHEPRLQDLITKHSPDLVILTLGANDTTVPFPSSLASNVRSLASKMSAGGRACYWMAPAIWRKDTGIVSVIKKNAAPCKVFDASYMTIARAGDGIHPTDRGGATWADGFFAYYSGSGPATPNEPTGELATK